MTDGLFTPLGESGYRLTFAQPGIQFDLDRLRRERHELHGELAVSCGIIGARAIDGLLSVGTFNVSSPRARQERARLLAERARTRDAEIDWLALLEELCQRTLAAERKGAPAVLLAEVRRGPVEVTFDVQGWRLLRSHLTLLFGDGGTLKSLIALRVLAELAQRGTPVLYADWELDAAAHHERLAALTGNDMPEVRYVRCERPLTHEIDRLRRLVRDHAIGYAVLDSVAFGCDGPPEAAEVATTYCRAVRELGIGTLALAHIVKGENGDQRPFGSTFWHNSARSTWFVKAATPTSDAERTIGLFNRKANLGPLLPPLAYHVTFGPRIAFARVEAASVDDLAVSLPIWRRMQHTVKHGPMTLVALARELDAKVETLDREVRRHPRVFARIDGEDGVARIALLDRGVA
jgi:hypothetical protein